MRTLRVSYGHYFEIGDLEYLGQVTGYRPPVRATWDDPGDGSEVDISSIVRVFKDGQEIGLTTWPILILEYAANGRISLNEAEEACEKALHDNADEEAADEEPDYPDSDD